MTDPVAELARVEAELATRWPESRLDPTLERIQALVDVLGSPQRAYPVIHLTGTNGKTSTARMIDALLSSFGLRVGRTTSPHLASVTERIAIDGAPISAERFVEIYDDLAPFLGLVDDSHGSLLDGNGRSAGLRRSQQLPIPLSYFEVLTAMAYVAFADAPVDVAVVEVGMGGSWDSTNVADGQVAVITPIDIDHAQYLGETISAIAEEKAGIIKPGATAVLARQPADATDVLLRRIAAVDATVAREGQEFGVVDRRVAVDGQLVALQGLGAVYDEVFLPLHGAHQAQNAACALAAVEAFFGAGAGRAVMADNVRAGFAAVRSPGRLEVVRTSPTVLVDAAHNPAGVLATVAAVGEAFAFTRLVGVVAVLADKDARGMLAALEPALDEIVVTENSSHRRLPADGLAALAAEVFGDERVTVAPRLDDAIEAAVALAEAEVDVIGSAGVLITGSVITAGDARVLLGAQSSQER